MKSLSLKRKLSAVTTATLLLSTMICAPVHATEPEDESPAVYFEYCAIDTVRDKTGPDGYPYRCLVNDLFYIEYPGSWSFGTNNISPIIFFNDSEVTKTNHEFQSFQDAALIGTEDQIDQYIQGGGLNQYFQQVLNLTDFNGLTFYTQEKGDTILVYSLIKEEETIASIVVWTSFGQVSIRDERSGVSMNPVRDYGEIMVMPVHDSEDFSSIEAIQAYVNSGKLTSRLLFEEDEITWTTTPYQTEHHTYLLCEGSCQFENAAVYIPVAPAGTKKWMVGFQAFINSEISCNAYQIREDIIKTFQVLK